MPTSDTGIGQFINHLRTELLTPHLDPRGPYSGDVALTLNGTGGTVVETSGYIFVASVVPPEWGRKLWFNGILLGQDVSDDEYAPPWGYLTLYSGTLDGSVYPMDRRVLSHGREMMLWDEIVPLALGLHVEPGWAVDAYPLYV